MSKLISQGLVFSLALLLTSASPTNAQTGQAPMVRVAVLDVGQVFENHVRLKQQLDGVKREVEGFEAYVRQEQAKLVKMQEQLRAEPPGSERYRTLEKQMASKQAELQVQLQLKRKEVLQAEAKAQYNAYNEIVAVVARFCERNAISMVVRYNSKPIDPNQLESIQMGVNRYVVFHRDLDITSYITTELNRGAPPQGLSSPNPQIPRRREP